MAKYTKRYVTKSGEVREYTYDQGTLRHGKDYTLVGKRGNVYHERVEALLATHPTNSPEDITFRNEVKARIQQWSRYYKGQKLSAKTLRSKMTEDRYEKMFINSGYELDEAAYEVGASTSDLVDEDNWEGNIFTNPETGEQYEFEINYRGSCWSKVD